MVATFEFQGYTFAAKIQPTMTDKPGPLPLVLVCNDKIEGAAEWIMGHITHTQVRWPDSVFAGLEQSFAQRLLESHMREV